MTIVDDFDELEKIRTLYSSSDSFDQKKSVPVIIHQLYNVKWHIREAWIKQHPSYIYICWKQNMIDRLYKIYHDKDYSLYSLILHRYGGIYAGNIKPNSNVQKLFEGHEDVYLDNTDKYYIVACPVNSKYWSYYWKHCHYNKAKLIKNYHGTIGLFNIGIENKSYNTNYMVWIVLLILIIIIIYVIYIMYYNKIIHTISENNKDATVNDMLP
jgi:hypothetical protein